MKKFLLPVLLLVMILVVTGCGEKRSASPASDNTVQPQENSTNTTTTDSSKILSIDTITQEELDRLKVKVAAGEATHEEEALVNEARERDEAGEVTVEGMAENAESQFRNDYSQTSESSDDYVYSINREEALQPSFDQIKTIVCNYRDVSGYLYEVTIKISPWILYADNDILQSAWNEVGGGKPLPTLNDWNFEVYTGNIYANNYASFRAYMTDPYYSVGSISIQNKTEGFDFTSDRPGSCIYNFGWYSNDKMKILAGNGFMNMVLYGNKNAFGNETVRIDASMPSNNWGPVPFCLLHAENIIPKYPDGQYHQEMENGYLSLPNYTEVPVGYSAPGENSIQYHIPFYSET